MNGIEPGLARRFQAAGERIAWRPAPHPGRRVAHLHDEEATIDRAESAAGLTLTTDPGPVGALVLVVEVLARGPPTRLEGTDTAADGFPGGALRACWGPGAPLPGARALPMSDVVGVARYALA